uniref:Uncharacterized protein n=1 Tax=Arundo donax TaxID=35708 RepID=A0A0A8Y8C8_ARUDO
MTAETNVSYTPRLCLQWVCVSLITLLVKSASVPDVTGTSA